MNLDLAGPGPTLTPDPTLLKRAAATWPLALGVCLVLGTIVALDWLMPADGAPRQLLGPALWLAPPLAALIACALAAKAAAPGAGATWICFGIGALAVLLSRIPWVAAHPGLARGAGATLALAGPILLQLALAGGTILALRRTRFRGAGADTLLDAALTLAVAALLLERFFFPALRGGEVVDVASHWTGLATTLAALLSFFFATLLVLRPDYRLPEFLPPFLLVAVSCFLLGSVMTAMPVSELAATGAAPTAAAATAAALMTPGGLATFAGWTILALTGFAAARAPAGAATVALPPARIQRLIHQSLAPGVALLLGSIMIDAALGSGTSLELGIASALLGLLLALRVGRTLQAGEEHAEAQRLLAQNSALVEVSRALADATDLNRTLDLVAHWACQLLDAPAAGVELLDAEQDELEVRALHGLPSHLLGLRTPVQGTLTGAVVRSGQAFAVADPGGSAFHFAERAAAFGTFPTAAAPLHYREERLGALFAIRFDRAFDGADLELLGALADQASLAIRNAQLFEQVRALSLTDPLTGLANRRQFARDLAREFAATRRGRQLIAILFDLDNFKEFNDRYGHPAGDEVLRLFGQALATETRAMNFAARYGGDEFVALLADTPIEGVHTFIERVAQHFQTEMERLGRAAITISAGFAECDLQMETPDALIAAADQALYRVKPRRPARDNT
jgi:diguanylate cyclase (GGDEF)-like protein